MYKKMQLLKTSSEGGLIEEEFKGITIQEKMDKFFFYFWRTGQCCPSDMTENGFVCVHYTWEGVMK